MEMHVVVTTPCAQVQQLRDIVTCFVCLLSSKNFMVLAPYVTSKHARYLGNSIIPLPDNWLTAFSSDVCVSDLLSCPACLPTYGIPTPPTPTPRNVSLLMHNT